MIELLLFECVYGRTGTIVEEIVVAVSMLSRASGADSDHAQLGCVAFVPVLVLH